MTCLVRTESRTGVGDPRARPTRGSPSRRRALVPGQHGSSPASVLGAILFLGGLALAAGSHGSDLAKNDPYVLLVTAGVPMCNMGGLLWHSIHRRWLKALPSSEPAAS